MRAVRGGLVLAGLASGLWGLWLMRDFTSEQLVSTGAWLIGGVVVHDAVLAPLTVLLGVSAARLLPGHLRAVAAVAFLAWATLTIAFVPVLSGQGGKPDNATILDRPYVVSWVVLTTVLVVLLVAVAVVRRRRHLTRI